MTLPAARNLMTPREQMMKTSPLMTTIGLMCAVAAESALGAQSAEKQRTVLVEAEGFEQLGGWVDDQQFMDEMGSPYLLSHGLGVPVRDATTTVRFPTPSTYRVWVRTRDWVAPWKAPGAPGRFRLIVDGEPLPTLFGTQGAKWHWQHGGKVRISKRKVTLSLHDLTGFEGRCDAIVFTLDADFVPPNNDPQMAAGGLDVSGGEFHGVGHTFIFWRMNSSGTAPAVAVMRLPIKPTAARPTRRNRNPPRRAPITPTPRLPSKPKLRPFIIWLASQPAVNPINRK